MKTEVSAGGVIVRKTGRGWEVLLIKDMNGSWTFPKGVIEKDEDPKTAARREIREEVGLTDLTLLADLPIIEYLYHRGGLIKKTVHYFLFQSNGKEKLKPQKEEGINAVQWFTFPQSFTSIGYAKTNKQLLMEAHVLLATKGTSF